MKNKIELSIIIVEYKSGAYLKNLLRALPKRKDWEVIVVDNGRNNRGYGGGCNYGAGRAKGEYLLFLNPDVLIKEIAIEALVQYLKTHPRTGVVGPKYTNAEGETEPCCMPHPTPWSAAVALSFINKYFPANPISRSYWLSDWNREKTREVGAISGAAMMVRAQDFRQIGGFDESYFLYWEELDLCKRYTLAGFTNAHVAEAEAFHPREVSMKKSTANLRLVNIQSRKHYFTKFFGAAFATLLELWLKIPSFFWHSK